MLDSITKQIESARLLKGDRRPQSAINYGNEARAAHYKHAVNGRTSGWHSLLWEENTSYIKAYSKTRMFRGQGHKPSAF